MANDKTLKIGTSFDSAGLNKIEIALKKLRKEGVEVAKAFKGINLGTSHGAGMFAKQFVDGGEKMRKFKNISEDTSRSLKTILGKTITDEQEKLRHYTSRVETLSRAYSKQQKILQQFKEQGGTPYALQEAKARSKRFGEALIGAQTSKESYQESIKELTKDPSVVSSILKGMGLIAGVAGVAAGAFALYQQNKTAATGNVATVGGGVGSILSGLMGNPASMGAALGGTYTMPDGSRVSAAELIKKSQGIGSIYGRDMLGAGAAGAASLGALGAGIGMVATPLGAMALGGIGAGVGFLGGAGIAGVKDYFYGGARAEESRKIQEQIGNIQGMNPLENMVGANLQATAGIRLAATRRLGGEHMGIAGAGAGVGSDLGESLSLGMGLAERFGARDVVGAQGFAAQALRGQRQGLGTEFTGGFLGAAGTAGANGSEVLKNILSEGVSKGMSNLDVQFFEKIGSAVARSSITAGGAVSTQGLQNIAGALMGGISGGGTAMGMHEADIRQQGMRGLDTLSQIPAVHFAKMAMAKRMLGPDASGAQILALANAGTEELLAGGEGRRFKALGISTDVSRGVLKGGLETALMGLTGNGKSSEAIRLQKMMSGPGGIEAAMRNPEFVKLAGAILSTARPELTQEQAEGAFGITAHRGDVLTKGKTLGPIKGGLAESQRITSAVQGLELIGQESAKTARGLDLAAVAFKNLVTVFKDVDIQSMDQLADKLRELITMTSRSHYPGGHRSPAKPHEKQPKAANHGKNFDFPNGVLP